MPWVVAVGVVLLLAGLAGLFIAFARVLRRDVNERFDRFQARLEEEANDVIRHILNRQRRA